MEAASNWREKLFRGWNIECNDFSNEEELIRNLIYYSDGYILNQARVSVRGNKIYHTSSLDYTQSTFIAEMEEGKKNMTRTGNHLGESEETLYIIVETESGCVLHTLKADGSYQ